jgi:hypothetical protein
MQEKNSVEQLKSIVSERDKRIKILEEQIEQLQENSLAKQMTSNQQFFLKTRENSSVSNNIGNDKANEPDIQSTTSTNEANEFVKQSLSQLSTSRINSAANNSQSTIKSRPDSATLAERDTISSRYYNYNKLNRTYKIRHL